MIGATIDQYKILKSLGASLVGENFLATHTSSGEQVVLEALAPEVAAQPGFRKAFLAEVPAQLQLDHPNIQLLINVLDANGRLFLVKEFQPGQTLEQWLRRHAEGLPLDQAFSLFKDMIRALTMAYGVSCPHQQLNPRKIWLTDDGEVKLLDFGQVLSAVADQRMSPADQLYAARYHSPERSKNPSTTDVRAIIYSLGTIFFEMLTGHPPFRGASLAELQSQHARTQVPDPTSIRPGLSPAFSAFFNKCLAKSPEQRQQTFGEVIKETDRLPTSLLPTTQKADPFGFSLDEPGGFSGDSSWNMDQAVDSTISDQGFAMGNEVPPSPVEESLGGDMDFGTSGSFDFDSYDQKYGKQQEKSIFDSWNMTDEPKAPSSGIDLDNLSFKNSEPKAKKSAKSEPIKPPSVPPSPAADPFGFDLQPAAEKDFDFGNFGDLGSAAPAAPDSFADLNFQEAPKKKTATPPPAAKPAPSEFGGFDFGKPAVAAKANPDPFGFDTPSDPEPDFGFGAPSASAPDFGFGDFDFQAEAPKKPEAPIEAKKPVAAAPSPSKPKSVAPPTPTPVPESFDFGFGEENASEFDFAAPAANQSDPFGFGAPASAPDPFASPGKSNSGFDFQDPAPSSSSDPFGFASPPTKQAASDSGFDFGAPAPSASDLDFGLGTAPSSSAGSFDFFSAPPPTTSASADSSSFFDSKPQSGFDFGFSETSPGEDFSSLAGPQTPATPAQSLDADPFGFGTTSDHLSDFQTPAGGFSGPSAAASKAAPSASDPFQSSDPFQFGSGPSSPTADPFAFGESDDFLSPTADKDPLLSSPVEFLSPPSTSKTPSYDFDSNDDFLPVAPKASSASDMTTEDGAFSFDIDDSAPPTAPPPIPASAKEGLDRSLAKLEEQASTSSSKKKKAELPKTKTVRRFDKKLLGLTLGLAVLVFASVGLWWSSSKAADEHKRHIQEIQSLMDTNLLDDANNKITELLKDAGGDFKRNLHDMRASIEKKRAETKEQIEKLQARAKEYEASGAFLKDGRNDAYGTYMTILDLDPKDETAKSAGDTIRNDILSKVDTALLSGKELDALNMLAALVKANSKDVDLRDRHRQLADKLKKERSEALIHKLENEVSRKNFATIPQTFKELAQIDPASEYLAKRRPELIRMFTEQAQDQQSKRKIEEAVNLYEGILELDSENKLAKKALDDLKEERLRYRVERMTEKLQDAINSKNYPEQYRISTELLKLDPGNQIANSGIESVRKETLRLNGMAEDLRKNGQFKESAEVFRSIYEIDQNQSSYESWKKYEGWAPPPGMAYIPPGDLTMGSRDYSASSPIHRVTLGGFFIDKFEVTNTQFKDFIDANPEWGPNRIAPNNHDGNYLAHWENGKPKAVDLERPVTHVSWYAAKAYATWKKKKLPTEAQWERAAAGNTFNQKYWWGNYSDAKMAVYEFFPEKRPTTVGSFPANKFGLYEILGNVAEWVQDSWDPKYYERSPLKDPLNDGSDSEKIYRGGSYKSPGKDLVIQLRFHKDATACQPTIGFRCALPSEVE